MVTETSTTTDMAEAHDNVIRVSGKVATSKRRSSFLKFGATKKSPSTKTGDSTNRTPGLRSCLKGNSDRKPASHRIVSFDFLEVHIFLISIGDNPACEGAPLCISDECLRSEIVTIDTYEQKRRTRRQRKELVISPSRRSKLLLALGYTMEDIATAALDTQKARQERIISLENKKWDRFSAIAESASRKLKKIVGATQPKIDQKTVVSRVA
mmetsp:Transcript_14296/g.39407  ORF Transcript_14296/g.39407 Transcript_14296/m.39407 type:complete len:211 (-) Transcript_14296:792-1424(-)